METQNFIFVHGGLPENDLENSLKRDIFDLLKDDRFLFRDSRFGKYVVVGHCPVTLCNDKIAQANPIINRARKTIGIDGGCGLKSHGQLNLLIIPDINCPIDEVRHTSHDELPVYVASGDQSASTDSININWFDNHIKVLETSGDFTYAEHMRTGHRLWIYNEYIRKNGTGCDDCTDYALPVAKGDKLSLIDKTSRGYIVKKDGVMGWYYGKMENS